MASGRVFSRPLSKEDPAMAARPVYIAPAVSLRRRPLALTPRRLEANRRNAARSTGPRTAAGKCAVARNAIKHGFFAAQERWTPRQHRDFEETLDGLRDDLKPQGILEESCVTTMAQSYVRMATMLRYENIAGAQAPSASRTGDERAHRGGECARSRAASSRARPIAPRRTMAADDFRVARGAGDYPIRGQPR